VFKKIHKVQITETSAELVGTLVISLFVKYLPKVIIELLKTKVEIQLNGETQVKFDDS
jgi:hypothetical protein